jgi:hypothetical protein
MRKPALARLRCSYSRGVAPKLPPRAETVGQDHLFVHRTLITAIIIALIKTRSGLIEGDRR